MIRFASAMATLIFALSAHDLALFAVDHLDLVLSAIV